MLGVVLLAFAATRFTRVGYGVIALILLTQTFWLMPALIARIDAIVAGQPPPASSTHVFYIVLEMAKLLLLLALSIMVQVFPRLNPIRRNIKFY